jgi:hypothetical protein
MLTEKDFRNDIRDDYPEMYLSGGAKVFVLILYILGFLSIVTCSIVGYNQEDFIERDSWLTTGILFTAIFVGTAILTPYFLDSDDRNKV